MSVKICKDCGREATACEVLLAESAGLSGLDVHARLECSQATVARLKERVASLEETVREIHRLIGIVRGDYHEYVSEKQIEQLCLSALTSDDFQVRRPPEKP